MTSTIVDLGKYRRNNRGSMTDLLASKSPRERDWGITHAIKRDEVRWTDHRSATRHSMDGKTALDATVGGRTARLIDISTGGISAEVQCALSIGASVPVRFSGLAPMFARIIWRRGDTLGLEVPIEKMTSDGR
ncbi:MAG: PilZ domain-containing protein [Croceibacterium sp.]